MSKLLLVMTIALLSGCAQFSGIGGMNFENRITCSMDKQKAYIVSLYGLGMGVSSSVAQADASLICK